MLARIKITAVILLIISPSLSCVRNVHITLGDYFADRTSTVLYRVGFMTTKFRDLDCLSNLKLVIVYPDNSRTYFQPSGDTHNYSYHGQEIKSAKKNSEGTVDIDRTFGFMDLSHLKNPNEFTYYFEYRGQVVRGPFKFKTRILQRPDETRFISFGDHDDIVGTPIMQRLKDYEMDIAVLLGDYAYNIHDENGKRGDDYFDAMEAVFTKCPVILAVGNHEWLDNFNFFASRFMFPLTKRSNTIYRFHFVIHNALFIVFNFDQIYANKEEIGRAYDYLRSLLENASLNNTIKHRLFFSHRPFLCSNYSLEAVGYPPECQVYLFLFKQFDDLLRKYGVKVAYTAHQHYYERSYPITNYELDRDGVNYLVVGTGGNNDLWKYIDLSKTDYKALDIQKTIGFTDTLLTSDTIYCQFVSAENGKVLDYFTVAPTKSKSKTLLHLFLGILVIGTIIAIAIYIRRSKRNRQYPLTGSFLMQREQFSLGA